jgi:tripartite-type tricarboxylate transporter receptor subunit TctC
MAEQFGQAVVVENIAAAGGVVATNTLAKTAADGYTLGVVFDSFVTNPFLFKGVTHDPIKDFMPVSLMVRSPQLLVVNPASGIRSMAEFLRAAKEPNRVMFSTPGAGTSSRLSAELLKASAGLDITLISYRGGAQALNDLLGGQVTGMIASMSLVFPHVKTGRLTALGVSSPQPTPQAPEVPPIAESIPGFEAQSWTGMIAPTGTPAPVVERIHGALVKALAAPDVRQRLNEQGVEVVGSSAAEFGKWLQNESARWGKVIQERKITVDQ